MIGALYPQLASLDIVSYLQLDMIYKKEEIIIILRHVFLFIFSDGKWSDFLSELETK